MYADTQKSIPKWHAGWSKICPTMDNMRAALALRERTKMYQVRKINSLNCIHSFLCNKRASDSHQVQPCSWYYMVPFVPPGQMLRIGYIFFSLIFVFFYQTKYCKNGTSHSFSNTAGIALHLSGTPRAGISLLFQPQQPAQSFTPLKKNKM